MCALNATLFWGGWLPPLDLPSALSRCPGLVWLLLKMVFFFFIFSLGEGDACRAIATTS